MNYSFIIPVYNCKDYLTACVQSILAAGAEDFEILLVDDGSTDGSGALCDALAEKYPCIRLLHKENGGVSSARNAGLDAARGEYVLFVDGDDTLDAPLLRQVLADQRCREADMTIFGMSFDYYYRGSCYRRDIMTCDFDGILRRRDWVETFEALFQVNSLSPLWNKVFRRECLPRLDQNMFLYEDLEFVLRYMAQCDKIYCVPEPVYHYRQSEDEGNAGRRLKRIASISEFLKPIARALEALPEVPREQKDAVLVALFQTLAREKIAVSSLPTIREICEDYAGWYRNGGFDREESQFHRDLMTQKAEKLYLSAKKTALRHRIAVWAKAHHLYRR